MKKAEKHSTSIYTSPIMREQLQALCDIYGENPSRVIARLISDAYTRATVEDHKS